MLRIVQKFGGTSVADIERIQNAARRVKHEVDAGNEVAVVVSAMAGTTNQLVEWTRQMSRVHDAREYDVVVSAGERVLQTRSVEMAMNHRVRLQVLSSFTDRPGTLVVDEEEIVEKRVVSGIAYSRDEAKITVQRVADRPGVAAAIFGPLADNAINVDMIVQNISADGKTTDLTFTVTRSDLDRAAEVLEGC